MPVSFENQKMYFHKIGEDQSKDQLIIERPDHPKWGFSPVVTDDGRADQADDLAPELHAHEQQRLRWLHIDDGLERIAATSRSRLAEAKK